MNRIKFHNSILIFVFFFILPVLFLFFNSGCTAQRQIFDEELPDTRPVKLIIAPEDSAVIAGETKKFTANYIDMEGNFHVPELMTWNCSAGRITELGYFYAPEDAGTVVITGKFMGVTANTDLMITPNNKVVSLQMTPGSTEVVVGSRLPMKLTIKNSTGLDLDYRASWSTTAGYIDRQQDAGLSPAKPNRTLQDNNDFRANTDNFESNVIFIAPRIPASAKITATLTTGHSITTHLSIVPGPATKISIQPQAVNVPIGSTEVFVGKVFDSYGNFITDQVQWFATNGIIDKYGTYTPTLLAAEAIISAKYINLTQTASVNNAPLSTPLRIVISPATGSTVRQNDVIVLTAVGYDINNNQIVLKSPTWSTNNGEINDIGLFSTYNSGLGQVRIRCEQQGALGEVYYNIISQ